VGDVYGSETWKRVDPRLQQAFLAMQAAAPGQVVLGNGWRSNAQQSALFRQKPKLAAKPGQSNHEFGLALDITFENAATRRWVHANARRFGLWFPMDYEPWHVQLIGVDRHNASGGRQIGGGRDGFSEAPDGRFINPYDALVGFMEEEDNANPMTQFERMVFALNSPAGAMGSPDPGAMGSPDLQTGSMEPEDVAGTMVSEQAMSGPADVGNPELAEAP
jgi:hypothetical protein